MAKRKSRLGIAPFDASEYLDNEEVIAEYLAAALEDRNPDVFLHAVADVAKARGISKVAKDAGRVPRSGTTQCGSYSAPSEYGLR
jgi:probable addiction module antidote protein